MKFSSTNWPIPVTSGSLLLVEHRAAVAGEAARPAPAARCGSKEQPGVAQLGLGQRAIIAATSWDGRGGPSFKKEFMP